MDASVLSAMDKDALKKQIENMKYQSTMERWPLSKSIEAKKEEGCRAWVRLLYTEKPARRYSTRTMRSYFKAYKCNVEVYEYIDLIDRYLYLCKELRIHSYKWPMFNVQPTGRGNEYETASYVLACGDDAWHRVPIDIDSIGDLDYTV
ncbi:hypothetical protein U1Q18_047252 [Sarracenia purpurea var. burkii]